MRSNSFAEFTAKACDMGIRRHSAGEIAAKLRQAAELAAQGKSQLDIARALGISMMTYHRWRKAQRGQSKPESAKSGGATQIDGLRAENEQLRRLLVDLLLEKASLEQALRNQALGRDVDVLLRP
jgi:transposase-like protein